MSVSIWNLLLKMKRRDMINEEGDELTHQTMCKLFKLTKPAKFFS